MHLVEMRESVWKLSQHGLGSATVHQDDVVPSKRLYEQTRLDT